MQTKGTKLKYSEEKIVNEVLRAIYPHTYPIQDEKKILKKYKNEIDKITNVISSLGVPPKEYFRGVTYRLWSEKFYPQWYSVKHFSKPWAIRKFADYKVLKANKKLSPVEMEKRAIERTIAYITETDGYFEQGILIPRVCDDVRKRTVNLTYLVSNRRFNDILRDLPNDVVNEFFEEERLESLRSALALNPELKSFISQKEKEYGYED